MNFLSKEDVERMDLNKADRELYFDVLAKGGKLSLLEERKDGYSVAIIFET